VLEFVEGLHLIELLEVKTSSRIVLRKVTREDCSSTHCGHPISTSEGIIFNDIRSKNTMITPSQDVKLIDFGLLSIILKKNGLALGAEYIQFLRFPIVKDGEPILDPSGKKSIPSKDHFGRLVTI